MNDSSPPSGHHPPNRVPPRRATWRASDADRERAARRLRTAAGEGRLLADELEDRLDSALSAKTYGELDLLLDDLPIDHRPQPPPRLGGLIPARSLQAAIALAVAAMITLVLVAAVAGLGFGHSSVAAPNQPHPRIELNAPGAR